MFVRVEGLDTFYEVEGNGAPIVMLHGWGTSGKSIEMISAALADRFRVIRPDLPGFGWSQSPPSVWGSAEYAAHVQATLRVLGVTRAAVLGHSFGGRVAIALAATRPECVERLVLVASAGVRPRRTLRAYALLGVTKLLRGLTAVPGFRGLMEPLRIRWRERVGSRDFLAAGRLRPILVRVINEDLRPLLSQVIAPALVMWGDRDDEVGRAAVEVQAAEIPRARLKVFPGAGHFPFRDAPQEFTETLRAFLGEGGGGDRGKEEMAANQDS